MYEHEVVKDEVCIPFTSYINLHIYIKVGDMVYDVKANHLFISPTQCLQDWIKLPVLSEVGHCVSLCLGESRRLHAQNTADTFHTHEDRKTALTL